MTEHEVLCRAKTYLLNHGWLQGRYGRGGARCVMGAIKDCSGLHYSDAWDGVAREASDALRDVVDGEIPALWNDAPRRTFAEVVDALDRAILATAPAEVPEEVRA